MHRDRSPFRYVRWMAQDVVVWPFRLFVAVCVVVSLLVWRFASGPTMRAGPDRLPVDMAHGLQMVIWNTGLTVAILMTLGGIVGTDLERGFYRSWFSKPMSPMWYYLQRFLLGAVAILLTPLVLGAGLALALGSNMGLSWDLMAQLALGYLLIGGATLFFSVFTSRGWLIVFLMSFMQGLLTGLVQLKVLPGWLETVHEALPPFQLIHPALPAPHGAELWHVIAYGAGLVILAFAILRVRPLGTGVTT